MSNLPAVTQPPDVLAGVDLFKMGQVVQRSGMFRDIKDASQAIVKLAAGQELGIGFIASLNGLHVYDGKVSLGANVIAAQVRRHPHYDFEVIEHTEEACEIVFTYKGKTAGKSRFTMDDARTAKLVKPDGGWAKNPRNMLYARAMSNGARWFCPDVFMAPVYTGDELGYEVDDDGEIIDVPVAEPSASPGTPPGEPEPKPDSSVSPGQIAKASDLRAQLEALGWPAAEGVRVYCVENFEGKRADALTGDEMEKLLAFMEWKITQITEPPGGDQPVEVEVPGDSENSVANRYVFDSESQPSLKHTVTVYSDGRRECSCKGFEFSPADPKECKHIRWLVADAEAFEEALPSTKEAPPSPPEDAGALAFQAQARLVALAAKLDLGTDQVMPAIVSVVGESFDKLASPDVEETVAAALRLAAKMKGSSDG